MQLARFRRDTYQDKNHKSTDRTQGMICWDTNSPRHITEEWGLLCVAAAHYGGLVLVRVNEPLQICHIRYRPPPL